MYNVTSKYQKYTFQGPGTAFTEAQVKEQQSHELHLFCQAQRKQAGIKVC